MQATLLVRLALCLTLVTSLILAATMRVSLGELLVRLEQLEKLTESARSGPWRRAERRAAADADVRRAVSAQTALVLEF